MRPNLAGKIFGDMTVIAAAESKSGANMWICNCKCGNNIKVRYSHLKSGQKSCRKCYNRSKVTHGMSYTKEYGAWKEMKRRCYRLKNGDKSYKNYAGKGIVVCDRWLNSFDNFFEDMGPCPTEIHSLDRFPNNDGNYEPSNCRWATTLEQLNNRKNTVWVEYNGEKRLLKELADEKGVRYKTVLDRYRNRGYTIEQALIKPILGKRLLINPKRKRTKKAA